MSIASRQVTKEVERIVEFRLKEGFLPTVEFIISELSKFYSRVVVGLPSFRMRKQLYRKVWDIDTYNNNLSEIYDDINNLYEELVDQFTIVLRDFDYYDTERRRLAYEIKSLEGDVNDLLLTAEDTEGYLYAVHDSFIDRSKMNLNYTTCEINTDAGVVTLRESRKGIKKLDMSHYFDIANFPVLAEDKYAEFIVSNKLIPGSKFGYAFSDIKTSWIQDIISTTSGELQVSFIIELDPNSEIGIYISRIEMLGHAANPMKVEPLYSTDNINFKALPLGRGERNKQVSDDKKTVWNFSELRVRYLKFVITKDQEDEAVGTSEIPQYRYIYGFKHIEIFEMAYEAASDFYSTGYTITDPTGEELTIDKASLIVEEDMAPGTSIKYYLSLGSPDSSDPTTYNWVPISSLGDTSPAEQQVVDFRHVTFFSNVPEIEWDSSLYGTALEIYKGISFYKIYEFPYEPVRDTITLYRGKDNWQVAPKYEVKRIEINDEKHRFALPDYGTGEDASSYSATVTLKYPDFTPVDGEGLIRGSVRVKSDAGSTPDIVHIDSADYVVDYANHTITKTETSTMSNDISAIENSFWVDYQYDNEVAEPTVYTTYIYILNRDGLDLNIIPFTSAEREAGQFLTMTTTEGTMDLSAETFFHVPPGWHKVSTTAEPRTAADRFYSVNDNKYLYQKVYKMYAYAEKLQEVSWFELKYNTRLLDHSRYCVVDYDGDGNKEIIVNYHPQDAAWASASDDMLCPTGPEIYVLSYKYISTQTNTIYFKASFSREDDISPLNTPTLAGYTIKLGY